MPSLGFFGGRPDCQFKPKEWGFSSPLRILPKERMGLREGRHWEGEETVDYMGCWESHIKNLCLFISLRAIISC